MAKGNFNFAVPDSERGLWGTPAWVSVPRGFQLSEKVLLRVHKAEESARSGNSARLLCPRPWCPETQAGRTEWAQSPQGADTAGH